VVDKYMSSVKQQKAIDIPEVANNLSSDGIAIVENYYSRKKCNKIYNKVMDIVERIDYNESEIGGEIGNEGRKFSKDGMTIDIRGGRDKGMFDIHHIDESVGELSEFKKDGLIKDIIKKAAGEKPETKSTNLYYKESNTSTRGPHHDTFSSKFKSFVYLTDVDSLSYGPYSYVEGSHNPSYIKEGITSIANKIRRQPRTDSLFRHRHKKSAKKITGKMGTLIISNQTGVHFGYPQEEGYERMLVTNHHEF
jgi:hypothetical protein